MEPLGFFIPFFSAKRTQVIKRWRTYDSYLGTRINHHVTRLNVHANKMTTGGVGCDVRNGTIALNYLCHHVIAACVGGKHVASLVLHRQPLHIALHVVPRRRGGVEVKLKRSVTAHLPTRSVPILDSWMLSYSRGGVLSLQHSKLFWCDRQYMRLTRVGLDEIATRLRLRGLRPSMLVLLRPCLTSGVGRIRTIFRPVANLATARTSCLRNN